MGLMQLPEFRKVMHAMKTKSKTVKKTSDVHSLFSLDLFLNLFDFILDVLCSSASPYLITDLQCLLPIRLLQHHQKNITSCMELMYWYWAVFRQCRATYALTVTLLLYPGLGLTLGWHYTVVQCVVLHKGSQL